MNDWEKPNETSLSKKEGLRSLRYGRSYIFMLTYVFGNYRNMSYIYMSLEICVLYIYIYIYIQTFCSRISFSSWVSMVSNLKIAKVKLNLLTDINMLLMLEKGTRGGICHSIYDMQKLTNKRKIMIKM